MSRELMPEWRDNPLLKRVADLERQLRDLYGRNPLASAALDDDNGNRRINFGRLPGGTFGQELYDADGNLVFRVDEDGGLLVIRDASGDVRFRLGDLGSGSIGVETFDTDSNLVFRVDEGGMRAPALNLPYRAAQAPVSVTNTAWGTVTWETSIGSRTHPAFRWRSLVAADPATTGEARLIINGTETSGVVAIGASTADRYVWNWEPTTWPIGLGGSSLIQLQVRRTSGVGSLHAYAPDELLMGTVDDLGATPTGL